MPVKKPKKETKKAEEKYYEAVGRRKTATARARIRLGVKKEEITVNGKTLTEYFKSREQQEIVRSPFVKTGISAFATTLTITGSGRRFTPRYQPGINLGSARTKNRVKNY